MHTGEFKLVAEEIGDALCAVCVSAVEDACFTGTVDRPEGELAVRTANVDAHPEDGLYYGGLGHKGKIDRGL
jgi:hypothetical protein